MFCKLYLGSRDKAYDLIYNKSGFKLSLSYCVNNNNNNNNYNNNNVILKHFLIDEVIIHSLLFWLFVSKGGYSYSVILVCVEKGMDGVDEEFLESPVKCFIPLNDSKHINFFSNYY